MTNLANHKKGLKCELLLVVCEPQWVLKNKNYLNQWQPMKNHPKGLKFSTVVSVVFRLNVSIQHWEEK